jgi:hypothetical protein
LISNAILNVSAKPAATTRFIIEDTIFTIKVTNKALKKGTCTPIILAAI